MQRVSFQQRKLLIGSAADVRLERAIVLPELRSGAMLGSA